MCVARSALSQDPLLHVAGVLPFVSSSPLYCAPARCTLSASRSLLTSLGDGASTPTWTEQIFGPRQLVGSPRVTARSDAGIQQHTMALGAAALGWRVEA